jgi:glucose/mannose transport system substrate-binding protein
MFGIHDETIQAAQEKLAETVMDPLIQKQFNLIKGSIPARMDISRSDFDSCAQAAMDTFIAAAANDTIVPAFSYSQANSPDVQQVMVDLISAHFNSDMSAEAAVKKLHAVVRAAQ